MKKISVKFADGGITLIFKSSINDKSKLLNNNKDCLDGKIYDNFSKKNFQFTIKLTFILLFVFFIMLNRLLILLNYFTALVIHELSHYIVTNKKGYNCVKANLSMFGLSLDVESEILDKDKFWINLAGPMSNILLCVMCSIAFVFYPKLKNYLDVFCMSNLAIGFFNLLPISGLDGGKVIKSIMKSEKSYKVFEFIIRFVLSFVFGLLFLYSLKNQANFCFLLFAVFFALPDKSNTKDLPILKNKTKEFSKVHLLKIDSDTTIFNTLKRIKSKEYTIFVCVDSKLQFISETDLINLALTHKLDEKVVNIIKNKAN